MRRQISLFSFCRCASPTPRRLPRPGLCSSLLVRCLIFCSRSPLARWLTRASVLFESSFLAREIVFDSLKTEPHTNNENSNYAAVTECVRSGTKWKKNEGTTKNKTPIHENGLDIRHRISIELECSIFPFHEIIPVQRTDESFMTMSVS